MVACSLVCLYVYSMFVVCVFRLFVGLFALLVCVLLCVVACLLSGPSHCDGIGFNSVTL